ncbi:SDR family oxidoreductase [Gammaproteobacteria bacterium]|nr:SDR family oxidoreductase [Gammaproteobacteria bacterium]
MKEILSYEEAISHLNKNQYCWLITGVAGFIGSNLLETLIKNNQFVVGIDNLSTGYKKNLENVEHLYQDLFKKNFVFIEGDVCDQSTCSNAFKACRSFITLNGIKCQSVDFVLHQAALGSVPRSIEDPISTNLHNVTGFLNILNFSKDQNIRRFVYASSSSVYGDEQTLPKVEQITGNLLSPYAVTKYTNELYADVFEKNFKIETVGLRYFNVFGPRQDPNGMYAAVIPKWIDSFINNRTVEIYGDGKTTRDFCFIDNVVQANVLSALSRNKNISGQVYNIAFGSKITLEELALLIKENLQARNVKSNFQIEKKDFRQGDIRHSIASIQKAKEIMGYNPTHSVLDGIEKSMAWYLND